MSNCLTLYIPYRDFVLPHKELWETWAHFTSRRYWPNSGTCGGCFQAEGMDHRLSNPKWATRIRNWSWSSWVHSLCWLRNARPWTQPGAWWSATTQNDVITSKSRPDSKAIVYLRRTVFTTEIREKLVPTTTILLASEIPLMPKWVAVWYPRREVKPYLLVESIAQLQMSQVRVNSAHIWRNAKKMMATPSADVQSSVSVILVLTDLVHQTVKPNLQQ
jgi:hypothetical protein